MCGLDQQRGGRAFRHGGAHPAEEVQVREDLERWGRFVEGLFLGGEGEHVPPREPGCLMMRSGLLGQ